jgi:DNA-binding NarL/FixJ family response regulator
VDKNSSTASNSLTAGAIPAEKIIDLLSKVSSLRNNNQHLLNEMRDTIDELRELRSKLLSQSPLVQEPNGGTQPEDLGKRFGFTRREVEVARLLALGRSNQAIARELRISSHTARHHTQRILSKLEVHSRAEAGAKLRG